MPTTTQLQGTDENEIRKAYTQGVTKEYLRLHYHISEPRLRGILGALYRRGKHATPPRVNGHLVRAAQAMGAYIVEETPQEEQPAPSHAYSPQEYFDAIAEGLRQRDVESATLRHRISQLEEERRKLLSDLSQCKLQMASWSGPTALPGKSLGNGG